MELTDLFDEMRVGELGRRIRELFPAVHFSLETMLDELFSGRITELAAYLFQTGLGGLGERLLGVRSLLSGLILLGLLGAFSMQFSDLLDRFMVGELSFYFTYLCQTAILTRCFLGLLEVAKGALESVCLFIRLLMPTYLFAVGISTGTITAGAGYQALALLIYGVERILQGGFLPLVQCFFLLTVLEGLLSKEQLEFLLELIKKGIFWSLKIAVGIIGGLGFLQSVLTPAVDKLSGSVAKKLIGAIPGIGDGAEGVLELAVSSALVIKNGMGILLMMLLVFSCLSPLLELAAYAVTLKLSAAVMGIVSDKRLTKAMDRAGEAGLLLLGITGAALLFFLIIMAMTCASAK